MRGWFFKQIIKFCNTRGFNRLLRSFANARFSRHLIPAYVRHYRVNTDEVKRPLQEFRSLNAFFIRELKGEARPVNQEPSVIISPVDARLETSNKITEDLEFSVKAQALTLTELLGSEERAKPYVGGQLFVLYLSPADYHRIHAPFDASLAERYHLGGKSWPVNELGLKYGPRPLCTNYRIINRLTDGTSIVFVGATNVNSIICDDAKSWQKGAEMGYFQFGSTVILLFEEGRITEPVVAGQKLRMGEYLARFANQIPKNTQ